MALAPYNAVAAASFSTSIVSISLVLIPATEEPNRVVGSPLASWSLDTFTTSSNTIPSTTHRGLFSPLIDVAPRTRILGALPKVLDTF